MIDCMDPRTEELLKTKAIGKYRDMMVENLQSSFQKLTLEELDDAVCWAIDNHHKIGKVTLNNNYTKQSIDGTTLDILRYIDKLEPIVTSSGVMFKKHKECDNPLSRMIQGFLSSRKAYKDKMKTFDRGTYMFERYNLYQQLEKLNANSTYGVLGQCTSFCYNIYVAESITRQGRSYISASITLFESLLANNVKFNSLNEIITYITNIIYDESDWKYEDADWLDEPVTEAQCFYVLANNADPMIWIPTQKELGLLWDRVCTLNQKQLNRIYFKNNLYAFCEQTRVLSKLIGLLTEMDIPFMNPNKPPKKIQKDLDFFTSLVLEYVYYPHPYIDKLDRVEYMPRDIVIVSD